MADDESAPYWEATARGELVLARCHRCQRFSHPPTPVCPHCHHGDPDFAFEPVPGTGVLCSWTIVRQSSLQGFDADVPFVLADVRLDQADDVRLIGRLVDGPEASFALGDRVVLDFEALADGAAVPAFRLAST